MTWERPSPAVVWRAIDCYLTIAYDGPPPGPVALRLDQLKAAPDGSFYESDAFEHADGRYALRLGNRFYAHMKLAVEGSPAGLAIFRADTHDRHFLDLVKASGGLSELIARNEAIARAIEESWAAWGLRTVREDCRERVALWRAAHGT